MAHTSGEHPAEIRIRRVYDAPDGGYRVLVDRVWPRGVAKADLELDEWCRAVAPSTETRKDFNHDPDRFATFQRRYTAELEDSGDPEEPDGGGAPAVEGLLERWGDSRKKDLVLLYAAKDTENNHAVVLRDHLRRNAR
ncbi:DUF488 domain-containing protein [Citricoccus nitrophenolicus]|uniref:DUF488 domain-containing protein n=1 Tax=Citricoccus nitrophenolicus TaxID=863575 RepID=UPI0031E6F40A